jgi:hypothetical protein
MTMFYIRKNIEGRRRSAYAMKLVGLFGNIVRMDGRVLTKAIGMAWCFKD